MKILLDTNVILDFFLSREPGGASARRIFELVYQEKISAYATANCITDIYYIVAKRLGGNMAKGVLQSLFNLIEIVDLSGRDCIVSLHVPIQDYEDAVVVACAKKSEIDCIVTNDADFLTAELDSVSVVAPADLLKSIDAS